MTERSELRATLEVVWREAYEHLRAVYPPDLVPAWDDLSDENRASWRRATFDLWVEAESASSTS